MATGSTYSSVVGLPLVVSKLRALRSGIVLFLGKKRIEKYLIAKTKARFEPRGSNPVAQRAPDGRFWAYASKATVRRRKRNKDRLRALYDTGSLQRSIVVTKKGPGISISAIGKGSFRIGVKANSRARKYALIHQKGGRTPSGGVIPARPFLGVGKAEAEELSLIGKNTIEKSLL